MSDVWYMLRDNQQYVYHYTRAATLADHILRSNSLRLSSFSSLNDPREYKEFDLDLYAAGDLGSDLLDIKQALEAELKARWKIGCFVTDPTAAVIAGNTDAPGASLLDRMHERGHSRPRMWAQYADGHRGACLVFAKSVLNEAIRSHARRTGLQVVCGEVHYSDTPVVGQLGPGPFSVSIDTVRRYGVARAADAHIERYFRDLYLTKNHDWNGEREFRWLLRGPDEAQVFVNFGNALVGIAIGELFPDEHKPEVGRYALRTGITVAVMDWRRGVPQPRPITPRALLPPGDPDRPKSGW